MSFDNPFSNDVYKSLKKKREYYNNHPQEAIKLSIEKAQNDNKSLGLYLNRQVDESKNAK